MIDKIPMISIKPHGITIYQQYIGHRSSRYTQDKEEHPQTSLPKYHEPDGIISPKAARRIQTALKWLLFLSKSQKVYNKETRRFVKFRVCMVTITLSSPQHHSDQVIKSQLFNQLLTELREQNGMNHYVWRAEKQQNGNIHFHLITNIYLNALKLRQKWNRIQNKLGYVDTYATRMNTEIKNFSDYYNKYIDQADATTLRRRYIYGKSCNWHNPNSTDIHSIKKIKNLTAYLCKYLCKDLQNEYATYQDIPPHLLVRGKLWGLSQSLSALKTVGTAIDSFITQDLNTIWQEFTNHIIQKEYFTFIPLQLKDIIRLQCTAILRCIYEKLKEIGIYSLQLT